MSRIIDCDRHVIEPLEMWHDYADKKIISQYPITFHPDTLEKQADRLERTGIDKPLPPIVYLGDFPILSNWDEQQQIASALIDKKSSGERRRASYPNTQIESMDESGVAVANIFPTFCMYIVNHKDISAEGSLGYAQAYNRWLEDYCAYNSDRLKAVGIVSRHDTSSLVAQVEDIAKRGWKTITLRPEPIQGKTLGHPEYEAFWDACEANDIGIAFHGGTHLQGTTVGMDRFTTRFSLHACSHPMEAQMAFVTLLESGVLERHPKLRFLFLEAGCSWVPQWLWRLDNICYDEFPYLTQDAIKMLPSEYFKRQCWVSVEIGEPMKDVLQMIGHERLVYASDYPHPDHLHFDLHEIANEMPDLSEQQLREILEENPKAFFKI